MNIARKKYTPGPGWSGTKSGAVFIHASGIRIHIGMEGLIRFQDGQTKIIYQNTRLLEICGWNKKRALMVLALTLLNLNWRI